MGMGLRVIALGDALRLMAREISADINEMHYLAHRALLRILRDDPKLERPSSLSNGELQRALRSAVPRRPRVAAQARARERVTAHA
jgi:hypothetical protein